MELFWERGYEAASLSQMVEAAGLNKSSLYNSFGSKEAIFDLALDRYLEMRQAMLDAVTGGDGGLDDLLGFFEMVRAESTGEHGCRGCLGINTTTELGLAEAKIAEFSERYRSQMRESLRRPLSRAAAAGEIEAERIELYLDTTIAFMVSIAVAARGGAGSVELNRQIDAAGELVESWRRT